VTVDGLNYRSREFLKSYAMTGIKWVIKLYEGTRSV